MLCVTEYVPFQIPQWKSTTKLSSITWGSHPGKANVAPNACLHDMEEHIKKFEKQICISESISLMAARRRELFYLEHDYPNNVKVEILAWQCNLLPIHSQKLEQLNAVLHVHTPCFYHCTLWQSIRSETKTTITICLDVCVPMMPSITGWISRPT